MTIYIPQAGALICALCDAGWAFAMTTLVRLTWRSWRVRSYVEFMPPRSAERDLDMKRTKL